jgi:Putative metal-binding motif
MTAHRLLVALTISGSLLLGAGAARAVVGNCESNGGLTCITAIQNSGGVVNDVFKDKNGLTGPQLPVFGVLYNAWPGCTIVNAGNYLDEYQGTESECPQVPPHNVGGYDFTAASAYVNALDWKYVQPVRLVNGHGTSQGGACPSWDQSGTWVNETGATSHDGYVPREGLVWDLGGPSNKVAIFAVNDHGPQPCESTEYTVWLTNDPQQDQVIDAPTTTGADPSKWNRAVLQQIYTHGWIDQRTPSPGNSCGDTANYAVEADSFVTVYGLPCGIAFRYVSVIAGNDGVDFAECSYDSFDGEIDAVAGLTEEGSGVCPDADHDGFVDCNCPGAPTVCDCDDSDPAVHPGAPEPCDSAKDLNCDGNPGSCPTNLYCYDSLCLPTCDKGEFKCPAGATCQTTDVASLCVPDDCTTGGCPAGSVCDPVSKTCKPACDGVVCPYAQVCQDGQCVDPCASIQCPSPLECVGGECKPPCSCFAGDAGCDPGLVCDKGGSDMCVTAVCQGVSCSAPQHCSPTTGQCVGLCDGAVCPQGQKCDDTKGCVGLCDGVSCPSGQACDPATGACSDNTCTPACGPPTVCQGGQCVFPDGGAGTGGTDGGAGSGGTAANGTTGGTDAAKDEGGCGCRAPGSPVSDRGIALLASLAALAAYARRRRRQRR